MQGYEVFTPAITRGFGLGQLETVLKSAMQSAGVEGRPSVLLIEDHHVTSDDILETVNSLLSAGEWRPMLLFAPTTVLACGRNHSAAAVVLPFTARHVYCGRYWGLRCVPRLVMPATAVIGACHACHARYWGLRCVPRCCGRYWGSSLFLAQALLAGGLLLQLRYCGTQILDSSILFMV